MRNGTQKFDAFDTMNTLISCEEPVSSATKLELGWFKLLRDWGSMEFTKKQIIEILEASGIDVVNDKVRKKDLARIKKILEEEQRNQVPDDLGGYYRKTSNSTIFHMNPKVIKGKSKSDFRLVVSPGPPSGAVMRIFGDRKEWRGSNIYNVAIIGMGQDKARAIIKNWDWVIEREQKMGWLLKMFKSEIETFAKKGKL